MSKKVVNRYRTQCQYCYGPVAPRAGFVTKRNGKWAGEHLACGDSGQPEVTVTTFSSGETITRNRRGRCEDAPCCGCCTG